MKALARCIALLLVTLAGMVAAPAAEAGQKVTFRFDPPTGRSLIQSDTISTRTSMGSRSAEVSTFSGKTRLDYRDLGSGFEMSATTFDFTITEDGQPVHNPLLSVIQALQVRYGIDRQGRLVRVTGYDQLKRRLYGEFTDTVAQYVARYFEEDDLVANEMASWAFRYGMVAGKTLEIGRTYRSEEVLDVLDNKHVHFHVALSVAGWERTPQCKCVRLNLDFQTDPRSLPPSVPLPGTVKPTRKASFQGEAYGKGTRLIDPETLMIWEQKLGFEFKTELEISKGIKSSAKVIVLKAASLGYE